MRARYTLSTKPDGRLTRAQTAELCADSAIRSRVLPRGEKKYTVEYKRADGRSEYKEVVGHFDSTGCLEVFALGKKVNQ